MVVDERRRPVGLVVGDLGRSTVDRVLGSVDVESEVDTSVGEGIHAGVVLGSVVDSVDTDSVDAELLELGDVALAAIGIGNGILRVGGAT